MTNNIANLAEQLQMMNSTKLPRSQRRSVHQKFKLPTFSSKFEQYAKSKLK